jgi:hypothetical protein
MSAKCHKQTFCAAAKSVLFDHLVGEHKEVMRQLDADHSCGLKIEGEYEFGGLLYR